MTTNQLRRKEQEIMNFLHRQISDPALQTPDASDGLKRTKAGRPLHNQAHETARRAGMTL